MKDRVTPNKRSGNLMAFGCLGLLLLALAVAALFVVLALDGFFAWLRLTDLTAQWLNTTGLLLGMAGVLNIFRWGPPQPDFNETVGLGLEPGTVLADGTKVSDMAEAARQRKRRHDFMSRVGLGLIGVGFAVQLWAVWLPTSPQ